MASHESRYQGQRGVARGRGGGRGTRAMRGTSRYATTDDDDGQFNAHLAERFSGRSIRNKGDRMGSNTDSMRVSIPVNPDIARYVHTQQKNRAEADPKEWLGLPEIPTAAEILVPEGTAIPLPRNRINSPWSKKERYLKAHYKLLREDTVAPLRDAVERFRKDPNRMDDHETRIYDQVRIVGLTFNSKGIASRIKFSTHRSGKRLKWSASKRLTSGTLVALTPSEDAFASKCYPAVVAARPLANLELDVPEIDIFFTDDNHHDLNPQNTYTMVEATSGYFEAYRHTLCALQKQATETFPLSQHICQLKREIEVPEYVVERSHTDMSPAAAEDREDQPFRKVDITKPWPTAANTCLDQSQWLAMHDILTRKLAIVQGPPGTGKTHVSKIALEIMLRNRSADDSPIIIACQTNHALDQLLTKIIEFEPNFIRLGGRSGDTAIKQRALHEVRKSQVIDDVLGSVLQKARRDLSTAKMKLKSVIRPVREDLEGPITAEMLLYLGIINQAQYDSLKAGSEQWIRADDSSSEPLAMWLSKSLRPFVPFYAADNFGFEEIEEDLELEQQKELDAEMGVVDEEDLDMLKGEFVPLSMGYTMSQPSQQTLEEAKRHLENKADLYSVQEYLKGPMYLIMQERARSRVLDEFRKSCKAYNEIAAQLQIGKWEKDAVYLSEAKVIGMTTTGLSKYRALISALRPKIVLIEEAAEVLEGPVTVACVESLQHLILVGDHEQLQAHCSVKELEGQEYKLNISMFERLFRNDMPHQTLLKQQRMNPLFRELIQPVYPMLEDHVKVETRTSTQWGMGDKISWFFKHDKHEMQDETLSTYNEFEAQMVTKFYRHLVRNGVPPAGITVLTFYNGQRKKILRALKDDPEVASAYNRVKTVDSYQGEENAIVILSLVRSNFSSKIGFLNINNRNVVALSRAKFGFYIFGNGDFLAEHNELWDHVESTLHSRGLSGYKLPLTCAKHGKTVWVNDPGQFDDLAGGCDHPCGDKLECGHDCPLKCHPKPHSEFNCRKTCSRALPCSHSCMRICSDRCACDCDLFMQLQAEHEKGNTDSVLDWHKFRTDGNTAPKKSPLISDARDQGTSSSTTVDKTIVQESGSVHPSPHIIRNETSQPVKQSEHDIEYRTHTMGGLETNSHNNATSQQQSESRTKPVRQPKGPPNGAQVSTQVTSQNFGKEVKVDNDTSRQRLSTWNDEPTLLETEVDAWVDDAEELEMLRLQRKQIQEMGTECW